MLFLSTGCSTEDGLARDTCSPPQTQHLRGPGLPSASAALPGRCRSFQTAGGKVVSVPELGNLAGSTSLHTDDQSVQPTCVFFAEWVGAASEAAVSELHREVWLMLSVLCFSRSPGRKGGHKASTGSSPMLTAA